MLPHTNANISLAYCLHIAELNSRIYTRITVDAIACNGGRSKQKNSIIPCPNFVYKEYRPYTFVNVYFCPQRQYKFASNKVLSYALAFS